ncbi:hypothetical protein H0H93_007054 [Arthromyces matolae]|nr:hypothetical protein H0H93_007054 [Arthromyces matolae]
MQTLSDEYANERSASGFYEELTNQIRLLGKSCLADVKYGVDFARVVEAYSNNQSYVYRTGEVFRTKIFGQIAPIFAGTNISARGNHFMGKPGNSIAPIYDGTRVKDVLVVEVPTSCNSALGSLFNNQIATLNDVRGADEIEEQTEGKIYRVRECMRNFVGDDSTEKKMIVIHMGCKYGRPPSTGVEVGRKKRTYVDSGDISGVGSNTSETEIRLGAFYDPRLNEDYRGPLFRLKMDRLVQQDVRAEDGELVAPWLLYQALKPGVLILADCSLHVFLIKDKAFTRKIYQINAHNIRILDGSDSAPIPRLVPSIPDNTLLSIHQMESAASDGNSTDVNFEAAEKFRARSDFVDIGSGKRKANKNERVKHAYLV